MRKSNVTSGSFFILMVVDHLDIHLCILFRRRTKLVTIQVNVQWEKSAWLLRSLTNTQTRTKAFARVSAEHITVHMVCSGWSQVVTSIHPNCIFSLMRSQNASSDLKHSMHAVYYIFQQIQYQLIGDAFSERVVVVIPFCQVERKCSSCDL